MDETHRAPYQQQYLQVMAAACTLNEQSYHVPTSVDQAIGSTDDDPSSSSTTDVSWWFTACDQPFVLTPFILFCVEQRSEITAANPQASFDEITRLLNSRWLKNPSIRISFTNRLKPPSITVPNPYNIFYTLKRREIEAMEPEISIGEMNRRIGNCQKYFILSYLCPDPATPSVCLPYISRRIWTVCLPDSLLTLSSVF